MNRQVQISKGVDWSMVWIYIILVTIGIVSIYAVQYRETDDVMNVLLKGTKEYGKQVRWLLICAVLATFILLIDSKFFTATANLQYGAGLLLLLLVFPLHASVKGTNSIIRLGGFQLQPAELCKVFTLLAVAKFLSRPEVNFEKPKNHAIAAAITLLPAVITIAQKETGLALVYFALFLTMYREGLPGKYLVYAAVLVVITVGALLLKPLILLIGIVVFMLLAIFFVYNNRRRQKKLIPTIVLFAVIAGLYTTIALPFIYNNVLPPHHKQRVGDLLGIEAPAFAKKNSTDSNTAVTTNDKPKKKGDSYNVKQSKIAIGSGGFWGKGFLNNTQTRFDFVPEQQTDFIFCSVAEGFGFVGSITLLALYFILLWRITIIAERQRSTFSRVYAYGVGAIIFFHIFINMAMTMGLAPVIGIPLPFISYGGTSLITFTILLFILIRLDADRQMVLR